jgi:hypothetical protein
VKVAGRKFFAPSAAWSKLGLECIIQSLSNSNLEVRPTMLFSEGPYKPSPQNHSPMCFEHAVSERSER